MKRKTTGNVPVVPGVDVQLLVEHVERLQIVAPPGDDNSVGSAAARTTDWTREVAVELVRSEHDDRAPGPYHFLLLKLP